jgi:pimeloyl-ACP methyl ester carboxylesterase
VSLNRLIPNSGGNKVSIEIQEYTFDTDAVTLNLAEIPSPGAPLVLLHGGSGRWQNFDTILSDLAPYWHIYAPDFRGHGKSSWVPGSYRLQDYADDTITFLRQCLTEPAYLFGHSLGGIIALLVAAQYPEGVRAVAVGDAPLSSKTWGEVLRQSQARLAVWRDLSGGQRPLDELVEVLKDAPMETPGKNRPIPMREVMGEDSPVFVWLATNMVQNDPDMLSALLDRFEATAAGYEMNTLLPAIKCPVLLIQADPLAGGLMTDAEVAQAWPLLAHPTHIRLEGVSHIFHNERKEPIVEALKTFFQSC